VVFLDININAVGTVACPELS